MVSAARRMPAHMRAQDFDGAVLAEPTPEAYDWTGDTCDGVFHLSDPAKLFVDYGRMQCGAVILPVAVASDPSRKCVACEAMRGKR